MLPIHSRREVALRFVLEPAGLRVWTPMGDVGVARTDRELAALVAAGLREQQDPAPARRRRRADQHDPAAWSVLDDGTCVAPSGRRYDPETQMAQRVHAAREAAGLADTSVLRGRP